MSLFSCHDTVEITVKNDAGTIIETYFLNADSLKHGAYTAYYDSGKIKETCFYNNGTINGDRKIYDPDGVLEIIENYDHKGNLHGLYQQFYKNGTLKIEKTYVKNVLEGQFKLFDSEGKIKEIVTMANNEENGPFTEYFANGNVHWKGNYRNGDHEYGILYEYDSLGHLKKIMKCDTMAICVTVWSPGMPEINTDTIKYE